MSKQPKIQVGADQLRQFLDFYQSTCEQFRVGPIPSVLEAVSTAANDPRKLKRINLRGFNLGNADVYALTEALGHFYIIRELDLRDNGITDEGVEKLLMIARAQLISILRNRPPPSNFPPAYLLCEVSLEGNPLENAAQLTELQTHLELLAKEQQKVVAQHLLTKVQLRMQQRGADPNIIFPDDVRAALRFVSLRGPVARNIEAIIRRRGGTIDPESFVNNVHNELLAQHRLEAVNKQQAEVLQSLTVQAVDDNDDETVISNLSSLSDLSADTANIMTGATPRNSNKRRSSPLSVNSSQSNVSSPSSSTSSSS